MSDYKAQGIPTMVYYKTCMHQQTVFNDLGYSEGDFPVAERLAKSVFSLPMHGYLVAEQFDNVAEKICS
jgi:dTDP-4-amino-4,6-dideoxygalactose transaminase